MKVIKWADLKGSIRAGEVIAQMPVYLTVDGEIKAVIANPNDCISLTGMHPTIQRRLRAIANLARQGQEKLEPIERIPEPIIVPVE